MRNLAIAFAALLAAAPAVAQDDSIYFEPLEIIEGEDMPEDQVFDNDAPFDEYGNPLTDDFGNPLTFEEFDPNAPLREGEGDTVTTVQEGPEVTEGNGATLRGLDKLSGQPSDLRLAVGETGAVGWLQVTLAECRYPTDNPQGDAFAHLVIRERDDETPIFDAWMVASSPALSALDHARYDVWVINCTTE